MRGLSDTFVGGAHEVRPQDERRGLGALAGFVVVVKRQLLAPGEDIRVVPDELACHVPGIGALDRVDLEEIEPAAQAVQQPVPFAARGRPLGRRDLPAQFRDALGVRDEVLVSRFGRGERVVVVRRAHVVRPEQLLLRRRDTEVVLIQFFEIGPCIHGSGVRRRCGGVARHPTRGRHGLPTTARRRYTRPVMTPPARRADR